MSMMGVAMILPFLQGETDSNSSRLRRRNSPLSPLERKALGLKAVFPVLFRGENDVEIRPQIQGFLTRVNVEEGQHVSKGQTLFVIDQVQLQAAVDAAKAQVEVAKARCEYRADQRQQQ